MLTQAARKWLRTVFGGSGNDLSFRLLMRLSVNAPKAIVVFPRPQAWPRLPPLCIREENVSILTAIEALVSRLENRVSLSKADLAIHGNSETHFSNTPPDAVVFPETTAEVSEIMQICSEHDCPVIPWGTGTSLEGSNLAVRGGIVVDTSRMNRLLKVNPEDMDCVVQPGLTRMALNQELRATGLFFTVDPGADAALGGMAATRASGTTTVRYGTMKDNVLALEVVLADGRIIRTGSRARKTSAGYDLTSLFLGSEGTLGIITELTLKLRGQPESIASAVCAFPDEAAAITTVIETIQVGLPMARIELIDADTVRCFNTYAGRSLPELPHLMLEFHGSKTGVAEQVSSFEEFVQSNGGSNFEWATNTEDRNSLWQLRHDGYYAVINSIPGSQGYVTDACVPISRLAEAIAETSKDISESPLSGPILGHVGDGNFHAVLLLRPDHPEDLEEAHRIAGRIAERAIRLGGTITGEHGVGIGKIDYLTKEHGDAVDVMVDLKRAMDPKNILNPGKIFEIN